MAARTGTGPTPVERCEHEEAPRSQWDWLPLGSSQTLSAHPWCKKCGTVKHLGGPRAQDMGGLANRLSRLFDVMRTNGIHVTQAQRRLIMKRIETLVLDDRFALSRLQQEHGLVPIVSVYTGVSEAAVERFLDVW